MLFSPSLITFVVISALFPGASALFYLDINFYPNPQLFNGYSKCRLDRRGTLCDPDGVLGNETEHAQLIQILDSFPNKTQNPLGQTSCKRKEVTVGIALSKRHIFVKETKSRAKKNEYEEEGEEGEEEEERSDQYFTGMIVAEKLAEIWKLDEDCHKGVIILYPVNENMDSVTLFSYKNVPILEEEKAHLLAMENGLFKAHKHFAALKALLNGLRQIIVHRQELFSSTDDDDPPASCPSSSHLPIIFICTLIALCLAIVVPPTFSLAINRFMAKRRRSAQQHIVDGPLVTAAGLNLISNVD